MFLYGFKTELRALVSTGRGASFLDAVIGIADQYDEYKHDQNTVCQIDDKEYEPKHS